MGQFRFEQSPPTPLESASSLRRRGFSVLAPLTAAAALLALFFQQGHPDPLDRVALPLISATLLLIFLGLRLRWVTLEHSMTAAFWICAIYLVALFNQQFNSFVPVYHLLSEGVFWFPALYMIAFIIWPAAKAAQVSGLVMAATLLIALLRIVPLYQDGLLPPHLLAATSQFFIANLLVGAVQYIGAQSRRQYEEMRRLAYLDSLTGLPNRRAAQSMLERLDASKQSYSVILFDLDHFKTVNDRYGHAEGDQVLAQAARLAGQHLAAPNLLARWGGEEFLMVLPQLSAEEAYSLAERARLNLGDHWHGVAGQITATFGVAAAVPNLPGNSHQWVLERADRALRDAKNQGRNRTYLAAPEDPPAPAAAPKEGRPPLNAGPRIKPS